MPQHEPTMGDEKEGRLDLIRGLLLRGMSQAEIVRECQEKQAWGVSDRQIRNYVKECWENMGTDAVNIDRAAYFTRSIERLDLIYHEAMDAKNLKVAREATVDVIKLLRLDVPSADLDWRKAMKDAGLDPQEAIQEFTAMFNKGDHDE